MLKLIAGGGYLQVFGLNPDHGRFNLGWRLKTVPRNLDQVVHPCQELDIDGQSAVEIAARPGDQSHRELPLEHEDCAAENGPVLKEFKDEGRGDLVRSVGDAEVEERKWYLDSIARNHLKLV